MGVFLFIKNDSESMQIIIKHFAETISSKKYNEKTINQEIYAFFDLIVKYSKKPTVIFLKVCNESR
jgi:hypothetical protein